MSKILVTGGAGYIGSHTVVELIAAGHTPVIVDNFVNSQKSVLKKLKEITGQDIACYEQGYQDIPKLRTILTDEKIDGIIHFAAYKAVGESVEQPLKYYQNNVAGLVSLLELVEELSISNFVFSSSCTVYGEPDSLPVTEDSPIKPAESPYGATKQMCETILSDATKASTSLRSIALRYFNPIGAHPSALIGELPLGTPANLVPFLVQVADGKREKLQVFGDDYPTPDGTCIRDYIHVVDLAKAHVAALAYLDKQDAPHYTFCNLGTGQGSSVLELITTFKEVTGVDVPYIIAPRRDGDVVATYAATDKAKELLNWQTKLSLGDALADAWRWQQSL